MAPNSADSQGQATSTTGGAVAVIDHNHLLFLNSSDVSGIQIISFQLTGVENYSVWFRSMKIALLGRNKLGMVDGSCKKEMFPGLEPRGQLGKSQCHSSVLDHEFSFKEFVRRHNVCFKC